MKRYDSSNKGPKECGLDRGDEVTANEDKERLYLVLQTPSDGPGFVYVEEYHTPTAGSQA